VRLRLAGRARRTVGLHSLVHKICKRRYWRASNELRLVTIPWPSGVGNLVEIVRPSSAILRRGHLAYNLLTGGWFSLLPQGLVVRLVVGLSLRSLRDFFLDGRQSPSVLLGPTVSTLMLMRVYFRIVVFLIFFKVLQTLQTKLRLDHLSVLVRAHAVRSLELLLLVLGLRQALLQEAEVAREADGLEKAL